MDDVPSTSAPHNSSGSSGGSTGNSIASVALRSMTLAQLTAWLASIGACCCSNSQRVVDTARNAAAVHPGS